MTKLELGALPPPFTGGAASHAPAPAGYSASRVNLPPAPQPQQSAVDPEAVRKALDGAVNRIREILDASTAAVEFSLDNSSGRVVLRVVDGRTNELIRQIPSDEVLAIAHALERVQGLLIREQA